MQHLLWCGIAAVAWGLAARAWWGEPGKRGLFFWCLGSALVALAVWWPDAWAPVAEVFAEPLPLQEGSTDLAVQLLHGRGAHAGPLHTYVVVGWLGEGSRLPQMANVQLALGLGAAIASWPLWGALWCAWGGAGARWGTLALAATVVGFLFSAPAQLALRSEGPAAELWWALLVWAAGVQAARRDIRLAFALWVAGAVVVGSQRVELLALAPFVAALMGRRAGWGDVFARLGATWRSAGVWRWAGLGLWALGAWLLQPPVGWGKIGWAIRAFQPVSPAWLAWPFFVGAVLPLGCAGLMVAGALAGARQSGRQAGLFWALTALWGVVFVAAHGGSVSSPSQAALWELVRYAGLALPLWCGLAVAGLAAVSRRVPGPALALCLVGAWAVPSLVQLPAAVGLPGLFWSPERTPGWADGRPSGDLQAEVAWLLAAESAAPECAFVMRAEAEEGEAHRAWWRWLGPQMPHSGRLRRLRRPHRRDGGLSVLEAASADGVQPTCVVEIRGMSCDRVDAVPCAPPSDQATPLLASRPAAPAYAHPDHRWALRGEGWSAHRVLLSGTAPSGPKGP